MLNVVSSIAISYMPIFILGCVLDLLASLMSRATLGFNPVRAFANCLAGGAGVWLWCHAYSGTLHLSDISGPIVFWGMVPAIAANFHKFNWTYVTNAKKQMGGGAAPGVLRVKPTPLSAPTLIRTRNTVPEAAVGSVIGAIAISSGVWKLVQPLSTFSALPIVYWLLLILGIIGLFKAVTSMKSVVAVLPKDF